MIDFFDKKLRLIGFYNKPNQSMNDEMEDVESAMHLASLLKDSFKTLFNNHKVDALFRSILMGNTVFILKDEENKLYAYYPYKEKARVSGVRYNKKAVTPMPLTYKSWFIPGQPIKLFNLATTRNEHARATITTSGCDFLITKNGATLPLDWDEDRFISISDLSKLIEDSWLVLITYDTEDDCGDCDGYDYSDCDMSRCKNDCENCGGRKYICNNGCFNHRYDHALRLYINSVAVSKELSPLIEILKLVLEPYKKENHILFTQYHTVLTEAFDRCRFVSEYFSEELIKIFMSLMVECTKLSEARDNIDKSELFSLFIGTTKVFCGDLHSVECRDEAVLLPWKTYHIVTKSTSVYDTITDSLVSFDYKLKFSSKEERNCFVEKFNAHLITSVYLSEISDSKKEVLKYF